MNEYKRKRKSHVDYYTDANIVCDVALSGGCIRLLLCTGDEDVSVVLAQHTVETAVAPGVIHWI